MTDNKVPVLLPRREWTSPEDVVEMATKLLERAKAGELKSLVFAVERSDGQMEHGSTRTDNVFAIGGHLLYVANELMGPR